MPGVQSVALTDIVPMRVGENNLPYWASAVEPPPNQTPVALASGVTPEYLNVMGIPLRHGRFFNDDDRIGHPLVVVVDEVLAQHAFGREDAVGKPLWIPSISQDPVQIVGVVGHVRHWGLAGDDESRVRDQIYYPFAQVPDPLLHLFSSFMSIAIRTNVPPLNLVESLQRNLRGVANDQVLYDVRTMEQLVNDSLSTQRFLLVHLFRVRRACLAARVHWDLRRAGIPDDAARPRDRRTHGARSHRRKCDVARDAAKHRNDFGWCWLWHDCGSGGGTLA